MNEKVYYSDSWLQFWNNCELSPEGTQFWNIIDWKNYTVLYVPMY